MEFFVLLEGLKIVDVNRFLLIDINIDSKEIIIMLQERNLNYNVIIMTGY